MMSRAQFEKEVLSLFARIVARDVDRKKITLEAAFKTELKMDSMGLISLVHLVEEAFEIDLISEAVKLTGMSAVREIVDLSYRLYSDKNGVTG